MNSRFSLQILFFDPNRWGKGSDIKNFHKDCLLTGIGFVYGGNYSHPIHYYCNMIVDELGLDPNLNNLMAGYPGILQWNDDPERTVEDVQELVKKLNI